MLRIHTHISIELAVAVIVQWNFLLKNFLKSFIIKSSIKKICYVELLLEQALDYIYIYIYIHIHIHIHTYTCSIHIYIYVYVYQVKDSLS